jgi:hypothetical protein
MSKQRALFICGPGERYKLLFAISRELEKLLSIESHYLVFDTVMRDYLSSRGVEAARIDYLIPETEFGSWGDAPVDLGFLRRMEEEYGLPNLWLYWEGIRKHKKIYDHYNSLKVLETGFRSYLALIQRKDFDFGAMDLFAASIPTMILSRLLELQGRPMYMLVNSPLAGRFVVCRGLEGSYQPVERAFAALKARPLSPEERKPAEDFLAGFGRKRYFSTGEAAVLRRQSLNLGRIKRGLRGLYEAYRFKTYRSYRHLGLAGPLKYYSLRVKTLLNSRYLSTLKMFEEPDFKEPYVLFLLHKQPEASTFVKAPFYLDQAALVENIAKSLPVGHRLYVKPHHNDFGAQSAGYYRQMLCRPNVKLLRMNVNSQELVRRAAAVVTITGTAGWEAIVLGRPVLTLGNIFYNDFDQVIRVGDIARLPYLLREAIYNYRPDTELALKYIAAHFLGSHEGVVLSPAVTEGRSLDPDNVRMLAAGLRHEIDMQASESAPARRQAQRG